MSEEILGQKQADALLYFQSRYTQWRGSVKNLLGAGGLYGFAMGGDGGTRLEPTRVGGALKAIKKSNGLVLRGDAINLLRDIESVLENRTGGLQPQGDKELPEYITKKLADLPRAARAGFLRLNTAIPSEERFEQFCKTTDGIRRDIPNLFSILEEEANDEASTPEPAPVAQALTQGRKQASRALPASAAFVRELAQMQFTPAPGSNLAGEEEQVYQVTLRIGELDEWIPDAGVEVTFCIRQFQVSLSCQHAIPSLLIGNDRIEFHDRQEGSRGVKILHDYSPESNLREKYFRFEPVEGPDRLKGESDQETLFMVKGLCTDGDMARLEIRSHQLKVRAKDRQGTFIEIEETAGRRIAENWLRQQLYHGTERPMHYTLVEQSL